jgi:broad specificity phosphatase PhoE
MPLEALDHLARPSRRRIYLVRHGDVTYFDDYGRPYRPDTVPLNPTGQQQAQAAARELAVIPVDRVLASDLPRCVETAALLTAGRDLHVGTRPALREIQPGRLADLPPEAAAKVFIEAFTGSLDRDTRFLNGETFGSLVDRVMPCFLEQLADASWRHLLIVAHGGVNRVILTHALGVGLPGFGAFEQDPCCLNIIDVANDGRCLLRLLNYTAYNTTKVGLELTTMEQLFQQYLMGAARGNPSESSRPE